MIDHRSAKEAASYGLAVGIIALVVANAAFIPIQAMLFPDAGGFTRSIIFIRPQDPMPGYYIIVDEIRPNLPWESGEVLFHGYGSLSIDGASAVWQEGGVSLNMTVLTPSVTISRAAGNSYYLGVGNTLEYVKIKPLQAGPVTVVTLLFPNNGSFPWPSISDFSFGEITAIHIGERDHLFVSKHEGRDYGHTFISTDAKIFFTRENETSTGVDYFFMNKGTFCFVKNMMVISSTIPITAAYVPGEGVFSSSPQFNYNTPVVPSTAFTRNLASVPHPYLLVNYTGLPALRARCNGTTPGPWQGWYSYLNTSAQALLSLPPGNFSGPQAAIVAFVGYVDNNASYLTKAGEVLKTLDARQNSYRQLIDRGDDVLDFALAYDFTYSSLSIPDQQEITTKLADLTAPLYDQMYIAPENNWRIVMAGGLGMAGLVLNNPAYVARAQEQVDFYHAECVRGNGACFEGQSYMRYALEMGLRFCLALRQLGGYDYFSNPRVLAGLNFSIYSSTPTGTAPLYEDCTGTTLAQEAIWSCNYVPDAQLAGHLKWYADRNNQGGYEPYAICAYTTEIAPIAPPPTTTSVAYGDDDYAFLRSDWGTNATYLSLSNKEYAQSHVHYDENSIELYAYGKKLLANGGYPGYKKPGHAWALSTEAQNTVLIGGRGQPEQRSNGLNPAVLTDVVDFVSGDALLCYQHPYSFAAVPGFLVAYIAIIALGIAILVGIRRVQQPSSSEEPTLNINQGAHSLSTAHVLKRALFPPTFDYAILTTPTSKKSSRVASLLGTGSVILLLEGVVIILASVLAPFIAEYTSSGNYTALINLYNLALIVVPILFLGIGFLATWTAFHMRYKIYRSLIRPQDERQAQNLKNLLKTSSIYSVFIVAVALAFLAWGIAPLIKTMFYDAFIQGGEVHVVIQYFIVFLHQCVILIPVIFATQFLLRVWQGNFLASGLQSEILLGNAHVATYRKSIVIPLLVTLILWVIVLTVFFATNFGVIHLLDSLTIESI